MEIFLEQKIVVHNNEKNFEIITERNQVCKTTSMTVAGYIWLICRVSIESYPAYFREGFPRNVDVFFIFNGSDNFDIILISQILF